MSVFAVRASLVKTLDDTLAYFAYDVQVELATTERTSVLVDEAMQVPGVTAAEPWRFASTQVVDASGVEGRSTVAFGLPPNARTVRPTLQEGRWLLPDDGNAIVATANIREDEPDLAVGDTVTLRIDGKDTAWTLVGIVQSPTRRPFLYAPDRALERATGEVGRAGVLMVVGQPGMDPASQDALAASVRSRLEGAGVKVAATTTSGEIRAAQELLFNILVLFLSSMAVLLGFVGGLGLTGTMTINVVERSREIGVLRAVGASDRSVLLIFLAEGVLIGAHVVGARRADLAAGEQAAVRRPGQRVRRPPAVVGLFHRGHDRVGRDRARARGVREPPARVARQPARRARDPRLRMREPDRR